MEVSADLSLTYEFLYNYFELLVTAGFEPAHPEIVGLKSTALDHSAKLPVFLNVFNVAT